jgi:hypothetical protein
MHECDMTLHKLEKELGQHEYKNIRPNNDPLQVDFMYATRRLNFMSRKTALEVLRLKSTMETVEWIEDWAKEMKSRKSSKNRPKAEDNHVVHDDGEKEHDDEGDDDDDGLAEILPWLRNSCKVNLHCAEFIKIRKDALIQVVGSPFISSLSLLIFILTTRRCTISWPKKMPKSTSPSHAPRQRSRKRTGEMQSL